MADDDLEDLTKALKRFSDELPMVSKNFADDKAEEFLNLVKPRTPVDTGNLREHWECRSFVSTGDLMLLISNNVEYASWVEYGHIQHPDQYVPKINARLKASFVNGKYMMTRSINDILINVEKDYENEISNLWRRCGLE